MKVDLFTLRIAGGKSFYARVDNEKTMTVADAFDVLEFSEFPVFVGMCSLAAKMEFAPTEAGTKQIHISFIDENGKVAIPILQTTIEVKVSPGATSATVPFAFLLNQLSLPAFGHYSVDLAVDGTPAASTTLYVRQKA